MSFDWPEGQYQYYGSAREEYDRRLREELERRAGDLLNAVDKTDKRTQRLLPLLNLHSALKNNENLGFCISGPYSYFNNDPQRLPTKVYVKRGPEEYGHKIYEEGKRVDFIGSMVIQGGSWKSKIQTLLRVAAGRDVGDLLRISEEIGSLKTGIFSESFSSKRDLHSHWRFSIRENNHSTWKLKSNQIYYRDEPKKLWVVSSGDISLDGDVQISFGLVPPMTGNLVAFQNHLSNVPLNHGITLHGPQEKIAIDPECRYLISRSSQVEALMEEPFGIMSEQDRMVVDMAYPNYIHMLDDDRGFYYSITDKETIERRKYYDYRLNS